MKNDCERFKVYVLDRTLGKNPVYSAWLSQCQLPVEVVSVGPRWTAPDDAALVVTHYHYELPEVAILRRLRSENRVPILILCDGILEFRNTWEHPDLPAGSIFQPVLGHKLAAIGQSQARIVESWGNPYGTCEVVGLPKCDSLIGKKPRPRPSDEPAKILVCTARTPGFTRRQQFQIELSLRHLKDWMDHTPFIEPIWRITSALDRKIGVRQKKHETRGLELHEILSTVDAVVTTPSTVLLEAALHDLPVALLDYNNRPAYVPAAWSITAPKHIDPIVRSLLQPSAARMMFQRNVLHDALECRTPATPRMLKLIEIMFKIGVKAKREARPIRLPDRILRPFSPTVSEPENVLPMADLHPDCDVFRRSDHAADQLELNHYRSAYPALAEYARSLEERLSHLEGRLGDSENESHAA